MTKQKIGRLAMRVEGGHWNAYYAMHDTMDGANWLGSIAMRFVQSEKRKKAFMEMMKEAVADIIEEVAGERPTCPNKPVTAPEHERTKK